MTSSMKTGVVGTCALALREVARPDIKQTKSTLMGTVLRLGDVDTISDEALEIVIKTSKCTALSRPKGWKKFGIRERLDDEDVEMSDAHSQDDGTKVTYAQLKMRTEYLVDRSGGNEEDKDGDIKMEDDDDLLLDEGDPSEQEKREKEKAEQLEKVEKEQLVRGFKYGTTYAPCPDGQFPRLHTKKGIDICGFFPAKNVRTFSIHSVLTNCVHFSSVASSASEKFNTFGRIHLPRSSR
jgi:ATP-dependent DNA helicase 2 subunit 2